MATESVHTPLVPVERSSYTGGDMLVDHVSSVDPEVFGIMKNVMDPCLLFTLSVGKSTPASWIGADRQRELHDKISHGRSRIGHV